MGSDCISSWSLLIFLLAIDTCNAMNNFHSIVEYSFFNDFIRNYRYFYTHSRVVANSIRNKTVILHWFFSCFVKVFLWLLSVYFKKDKTVLSQILHFFSLFILIVTNLSEISYHSSQLMRF